MERVGAPFDEEWKQSPLVVFEIQGSPLKEPAVRALARTGCRTIEGDTRDSEASRKLIKISRMRGPADQAGLRKFRQTIVIG